MGMETIYVVLSRDTDYIYCTTDVEKAESERLNRIGEEEMQGGRPSVYIRRTKLVK
jgi:hypothetical protein